MVNKSFYKCCRLRFNVLKEMLFCSNKIKLLKDRISLNSRKNLLLQCACSSFTSSVPQKKKRKLIYAKGIIIILYKLYSWKGQG